MYPQKGNLTTCGNWGEVTWLSTPGKVYCQSNLKHMRDLVAAQFHEEQVGFRPKWLCVEQISPYGTS